ncbi:FecR family protein [Chitinophaga sp. Cy-1792]|uniref:FecR family protein n=1 Tax=Chitinophaga sp. Cy-1792 TaxID=2608339 RepID=UPI00142295A6|nr:FecR domain-containing protein [Chitinophaga sp. Cy-1792]NIG56957.1 DUF4974 domain-containing protein [Chitinophaga sp. Cy-1792]
MNRAKDYEHYLPEDFLLDEYFIQWVKYPAADTNAYWKKVMADIPGTLPKMEEAREVVYALSMPTVSTNEANMQASWEKLLAEIAKPPTARVLYQPRKWWAVAATLLLLVVATSGWFMISSVNIHTGYGETRKITLPDHSIVMLNANTTVTYPRSWYFTGKRDVQMQGEAFFDVKHLGDTFRVTTCNGIVTVLGTAFNVHARNNELSVMLQRGSVRIDNFLAPAQPVFLQPGEGWTNTISKNVVVKVDTLAATAWTRHELLLNSTKIKEIIHILEERYGYTIITKDSSILERKIEGRIPMQGEKDLLFVLSRILDVNINQHQDTLFITNKE